jgi:hypothetical protein
MFRRPDLRRLKAQIKLLCRLPDATHRVEYEADPASPFPKSYSGEVIVTLNDGRELRHREEVNRGAADRPITNAEIEAKFLENASLAASGSRCAQVRDLVLGLEGLTARELAQGLAARG